MQNLYLARIVLLLEQIMAVSVFTGFSFGLCYLTLFRSCAPKMNYISSAFPKHSLMNCRSILLLVFLAVNFLKAQHLPGKYYSESKTYKAADSSYNSDFFEDGFARFYHRGRVGIMDSSGRIILAAKYDKIFDFRNNILNFFNH